jgi:hypothetical protein
LEWKRRNTPTCCEQWGSIVSVRGNRIDAVLERLKASSRDRECMRQATTATCFTLGGVTQSAVGKRVRSLVTTVQWTSVVGVRW